MEPMPTLELDLDLLPRRDEPELVHDWRTERLFELGLSWRDADRLADHVEWRAVAALVERGCPAALAVEIAR